jgi:two-component sensor histidine kinase
MFHPDDLAPMWKAVGIAVDPKGDGRYDVEYRAKQPDGSWRWLSAWGIVEFEGEGDERRPVAIAGSSRDITPQKLAEEHQRLLVNELNHRVKNTTVHSIAHHTLRNAGDVEAMRQAIEFRIQSLARAHDLLTAQNWAGADVVEVVALATEPFSGARLAIGGPSVKLSPKQALALSMALHELGTNAMKYGALTQASGRVEIFWRRDDSHLHVIWRERGGRPVIPPTRRGFGSRLLEKAVALDLGGTATLEWLPEGVAWHATAALE